MISRLLVIAVLLAACADEEPAKKPAAQTPAAPAAGAPIPTTGAGSGKPLPVYSKVERLSQISCPAPKKDGKKCDPNALKPVVIGRDKPDPAAPPDLSCPDETYCLPTTEGYLCGVCPERDAIRHVFKDRDFAVETNRDPFQSFIVKTPGGPGAGSGSALPRDTTARCVKPDQLRVPNYGYQDLKLVGIVAQGTQRKVLMMDPSNYGHIIKRGECVGKEKAWVRDIGENFICFEVTPDANVAGSRPPEGLCVELHTKQIAVTSLPSDAPAPRPNAPVITPPSATQPPVAPRQPPTPPTVPPAVPQQAPTIIRP